MLGKSAEVLTNITQDLILVSENLYKDQIWLNTQDIKSHWDELFQIQVYWNSREEAQTGITQNKEVKSIKTTSKLQSVR